MGRAPTTFGQWDEAFRILKGMNARVERNMQAATNRNGILLRDQIKRTIRDQRPEWPDLADATIARKGSSKMLINFGDMLNSVNYQIVDSKTFFIGVPKSSVNRDGDKLVDIAAVHEYGAEFTLPNGGTVVIPQRAFIAPTLEAFKDDIMEIWVSAVDLAMKGKSFSVKRS